MRALLNVRKAGKTSDEFEKVQDDYLQEIVREKGVVTFESEEIKAYGEGIYLWQGDITRLEAIVNAAKSQMTGCYRPNHNCIDNCIHTYGGFQIRLDCDELMKQQGHEEETGKAKITPAYNLPCKYILHTVGPIVQGQLTKMHEDLLQSCYKSCLKLAAENNLESIAFCCISTGVFIFPNERAAEIAVDTVREYLKKETSVKKVIFNVFKDRDKEIYERLLG